MPLKVILLPDLLRTNDSDIYAAASMTESVLQRPLVKPPHGLRLQLGAFILKVRETAVRVHHP